jgi:hypothetical protein
MPQTGTLPLDAVPEREESLGLALGRAHMKYARRVNRRQRWWGETVDDEAFALLRTNTRTGWPTGSPDFIAQFEARLGRRLQRQPAGRKKKQVVALFRCSFR